MRRQLLAGAMMAATLAFVAAACTSASGSPLSPSATHSSHGGKPTAADGVLPHDATPLDTDLPALAKLDPDLLRAVQEAARAADKSDITFKVTTGWRSEAYQQQLLDEAIHKYGSEEKARRFVATPKASHHVTGKAIDIGPTNADDWLIRRGAKYGLCQIYANEMWHFELATKPGGRCPDLLPDASEG